MTSNKSGSSLLEVLVALTLFSIVMSSLAGFVMVISKSNQRNAQTISRTTAIAQKVNMLQALPYDSLPSRAGCADLTTGNFSRQECVTVKSVSASVREVQLVVTPASKLLKPDTITMQRGRSAKGNPLNVQ